MSGLMYEVGVNYPEVELEIIPGVTAATGGAALLGAPLIHDFCLISLSDLLTPWEKIEARLLAAAQADFGGMSVQSVQQETKRLSAESLRPDDAVQEPGNRMWYRELHRKRRRAL